MQQSRCSIETVHRDCAAAVACHRHYLASDGDQPFSLQCRPLSLLSTPALTRGFRQRPWFYRYRGGDTLYAILACL